MDIWTFLKSNLPLLSMPRSQLDIVSYLGSRIDRPSFGLAKYIRCCSDWFRKISSRARPEHEKAKLIILYYT